MVWLKRTRITLLMGLLVAGAALAWLAAHPQLYAGQLGRLVTRNLLQDSGATLSFADLRGNPLEGMTFYEVVLVRSGEEGEFLYVGADSVSVSYDPRAILRRDPVLQELEIRTVRPRRTAHDHAGRARLLQSRLDRRDDPAE